MPNYLGIEVDYSKDALFDQLGLTRLKESYMKEDETSPQQRFAFVANSFGSNPAHAQRLYDYASNHWLSFSTPILSFGRTKKGLPISCFAGGTKVLTSEGFKDIKEIKVGDFVLSHDGTFNEVEATRCKESDDIYELTINDEVFLVTGDHLSFITEDGHVDYIT